MPPLKVKQNQHISAAGLDPDSIISGSKVDLPSDLAMIKEVSARELERDSFGLIKEESQDGQIRESIASDMV